MTTPDTDRRGPAFETPGGDEGPSYWNYRVMCRTRCSMVPGVEPCEEWVLIEAYYDADDKIVAWAEAGPMISDVSLADFIGEAKRRQQAASKAQLRNPKWRVLDEDELPGAEKDVI